MKFIHQKSLPFYSVLCGLGLALVLTGCEDPGIEEEVDGLRGNASEAYDSAKNAADRTIDGAKESVKDGVDLIRDANEELKDL